MKTTAVVFNIQRYSIHDGPGIRTTVFLKGCPLSCVWCSNPESQNSNPKVVCTTKNCMNCGACIEVCNHEGSTLKDGRVQFNVNQCVSCRECLEVCPTNAREIIGKTMTVEEVIKEIEKDKLFYNNSGGGVTFSGGEPLLHYDFLQEIVPKLKEKGIHVAIETTGYCQWEKFWTAVKEMDLILFDLKQSDNKKHKKYVGVENELILENAEKIAALKETIFRIPVIPGYNDEIENHRKIAALVSSFKNKCEVHLIPYHSYGKSKYEKLGKKYELTSVEAPSDESMRKIVRVFKENNIKVSVL